MIITQIARGKKNKNRVNVFVDGTFAFALYLETAIQYGLKEDLDIAGFDLKKIAQDDEKKYSMDVALKYIAYQMRSKSEVRKKLKQKDVSEQTVEATIEKLEELGYLNDRVYAETYAAELKERMGSRGITHKLYERGIDKDTIEQVLQGLGGFYEVALGQAEKLFYKYRELDARKARDKVFRTLMNRGFEVDDIKRAINEHGAREDVYEGL